MERNTCRVGGGGGGAIKLEGKRGGRTTIGEVEDSPPVVTTPLPPTRGARSLPHNGANRRDLCCPPRSNGVPLESLDAGAAQR